MKRFEQQALECSFTKSAELGFLPTTGGVSSGYVKVTRKSAGRTAGEAGKEVAARVMTMGVVGTGPRPDWDELLIQGTGNQLRITAAGYYDKGKKVGKPSKDAAASVSEIMNACTSK